MNSWAFCPLWLLMTCLAVSDSDRQSRLHPLSSDDQPPPGVQPHRQLDSFDPPLTELDNLPFLPDNYRHNPEGFPSHPESSPLYPESFPQNPDGFSHHPESSPQNPDGFLSHPESFPQNPEVLASHSANLPSNAEGLLPLTDSPGWPERGMPITAAPVRDGLVYLKLRFSLPGSHPPPPPTATPPADEEHRDGSEGSSRGQQIRGPHRDLVEDLMYRTLRRESRKHSRLKSLNTSLQQMLQQSGACVVCNESWPVGGASSLRTPPDKSAENAGSKDAASSLRRLDAGDMAADGAKEPVKELRHDRTRHGDFLTSNGPDGIPLSSDLHLPGKIVAEMSENKDEIPEDKAAEGLGPFFNNKSVVGFLSKWPPVNKKKSLLKELTAMEQRETGGHLADSISYDDVDDHSSLEKSETNQEMLPMPEVMSEEDLKEPISLPEELVSGLETHERADSKTPSDAKGGSDDSADGSSPENWGEMEPVPSEVEHRKRANISGLETHQEMEHEMSKHKWLSLEDIEEVRRLLLRLKSFNGLQNSTEHIRQSAKSQGHRGKQSRRRRRRQRQKQKHRRHRGGGHYNGKHKAKVGNKLLHKSNPKKCAMRAFPDPRQAEKKLHSERPLSAQKRLKAVRRITSKKRNQRLRRIQLCRSQSSQAKPWCRNRRQKMRAKGSRNRQQWGRPTAITSRDPKTRNSPEKQDLKGTGATPASATRIQFSSLTAEKSSSPGTPTDYGFVDTTIPNMPVMPTSVREDWKVEGGKGRVPVRTVIRGSMKGDRVQEASWVELYKPGNDSDASPISAPVYVRVQYRPKSPRSKSRSAPVRRGRIRRSINGALDASNNVASNDESAADSGDDAGMLIQRRSRRRQMQRRRQERRNMNRLRRPAVNDDDHTSLPESRQPQGRRSSYQQHQTERSNIVGQYNDDGEDKDNVQANEIIAQVVHHAQMDNTQRAAAAGEDSNSDESIQNSNNQTWMGFVQLASPSSRNSQEIDGNNRPYRGQHSQRNREQRRQRRPNQRRGHGQGQGRNTVEGTARPGRQQSVEQLTSDNEENRNAGSVQPAQSEARIPSRQIQIVGNNNNIGQGQEDAEAYIPSPFINHRTAYDFLSTQARSRTRGRDGRRGDNEQQAEQWQFNHRMSEGLCEVFDKHFVPTALGGRCV